MSLTSGLTGGKSLTDITNSVDAFNSVSMDQSKTLFKDCLGTEFPFDVIDSVENYVNKLSNALNSSLDDLLCGNAVSNVMQANEDLISETSNSFGKASDQASGAYDGMTSLFDDETPKGDYNDNQPNLEEEKQYAKSWSIGYNPWVNTFTNTNMDKSGSSFTKALYSENDPSIGADSATISFKGSYKISNVDVKTKRCSISCEATASVVWLQRGPNTDGDNFFKPLTGSFTGNFTYAVDFTDNVLQSFFSLKTQKVKFTVHPGITLTMNLNVYNINRNSPIGQSNPIDEFSLMLGPLDFDMCWCDLNRSGYTGSSNDPSPASMAKQQALNALKSEFMTSSLVDDAMDDQLDSLIDTCPALGGINKGNVKNAMKESIADNAIALANGDPLSVDKTLISTIASEATASSVNAGLEKLGIDADISAECTKELLSGVIDMLPEATMDNPFGGMSNYIGFEDAYNYASGVIGKLLDQFDSLLSSDCVKAVNNSFDICDQEIADATGAGVDLAKASLRDASQAKNAGKLFI